MSARTGACRNRASRPATRRAHTASALCCPPADARARHRALHRRYPTLEVPRPRSGNADAGRDAEPVHLLVDSTGLKLCGSGEWLGEKKGSCKRDRKSGVEGKGGELGG